MPTLSKPERLERLENRTLAKVQEQPGINRTKLKHGVGSNVNAKDFAHVISKLKKRGVLQSSTIRVGLRQKPSEIYHPVETGVIPVDKIETTEEKIEKIEKIEKPKVSRKKKTWSRARTGMIVKVRAAIAYMMEHDLIKSDTPYSAVMDVLKHQIGVPAKEINNGTFNAVGRELRKAKDMAKKGKKAEKSIEKPIIKSKGRKSGKPTMDMIYSFVQQSGSLSQAKAILAEMVSGFGPKITHHEMKMIETVLLFVSKDANANTNIVSTINLFHGNLRSALNIVTRLDKMLG